MAGSLKDIMKEFSMPLYYSHENNAMDNNL